MIRFIISEVTRHSLTSLGCWHRHGQVQPYSRCRLPVFEPQLCQKVRREWRLFARSGRYIHWQHPRKWRQQWPIQTQNVGQNMVKSMRKRKGGWRRFRSCKSKNRWASLNPKCTNCTSKLPSCPTTENNKKSWMVVFSTTCDNFNTTTATRQDLKRPEYFVDLSKCGNFEEVKNLRKLFSRIF